jgi:hypothetical protein
VEGDGRPTSSGWRPMRIERVHRLGMLKRNLQDPSTADSEAKLAWGRGSNGPRTVRNGRCALPAADGRLPIHWLIG